jgi:phage FluMu protein Com
MARKTIGYVKLAWTCDHCETENPGPRKFCNNCGAPQPHDVEFHQPPEAKLLTNADEIERAKAGPDVHCPYCKARNSGDAGFCGACGGDLTDAQARESGKVLGAHRSGDALEIECPSCGTLNLATARECASCGDSLGEEKPPTPAPKKREGTKPSRSLPVAILIGVGVLCLVAIIALVVLLGRTEEQSAVVQNTSWTRSVPIEMLSSVEREDWADEVPSDATILNCNQEYRSTLSEPAPDTVEVCGTPYTVDTGSGFGEVVQDCVYELYAEYCSYTAMDWVLYDTISITGNDNNPVWPDYVLEEDQHAGTGEEELVVIFLVGEETFSYEPINLDEFEQFTPGSNWILEINTLGSVVSVSAER